MSVQVVRGTTGPADRAQPNPLDVIGFCVKRCHRKKYEENGT